MSFTEEMITKGRTVDWLLYVLLRRLMFPKLACGWPVDGDQLQTRPKRHEAGALIHRKLNILYFSPMIRINVR